jgi:hypothetical protein
VLALAIFLVPILASITLAGLNEDDALTVAPPMDFVRGAPVDPRTPSFQFEGRSIPWVVGPYTGLLHPVENLVAFWALGYNLAAIRLFPTVFAAATLVMSYAIARMLFSPVAASLVALLLAVNPVFVFWSWLEGYHSYLSMATMTTGAILCFLLYFRTGKARYLYLAAFLCGSGLATKLNFGYWLLIFAPIGVIVAVPRLIRRPIQTIVQIILSGVAFAVGAVTWLTFTYYHLAQMALIGSTLSSSSSLAGVDNQDRWANLTLRVNQLWDLYAGANVDFSFACPGYQTVSPVSVHWLPWVLVGSMVVVLVAALLPRPPFRRSALLFLVVSLVVLVVLSTTTPTTLHVYNATIYYPIPHMIVAVAAAMVIQGLGRAIADAWGGRKASEEDLAARGRRLYPRVVTVLTAVAAALLMMSDARQTYATYAMLHQTDGCGRMAGAIHQLSDYLVQHGDVNPVAMDWGLYFPVKVTSSERLEPVELFVSYWNGQYWFDSPPPYVAEELAKIIDDPKRVYLFYAPNFAVVKGRYELLESMAAERGKRVEKLQEIRQGDGEVLYVVYRVV